MKVTGVKTLFIYTAFGSVFRKGFIFKKSTTGQFSELFGKHPV